ncbi:hypothetical protein CHN50_11775 [Priestia aryabhattai]|nr:hypothetical protein CHN50_11775 [Priestia aryabhattai]
MSKGKIAFLLVLFLLAVGGFMTMFFSNSSDQVTSSKGPTLKNETIKNVTHSLTAREDMLLNTNQAFVFEYDSGSKKKEVDVWVEKYEKGLFVEKLNELSTEVDKEGLIIFTSSDIYPEDEDGEEVITMFNLKVGNQTGSAELSFTEKRNIEEKENLAGTWEGFYQDVQKIDGEMPLGYMAYSSEDSISSIQLNYLKDPKAHEKELKEYDSIYVLKCRFH